MDTLGEAPRRTLKVASVVGRSFLAPALPIVYPELGTPADVGAHLATLRALDLVALDRDDEQSYIFKHVVTQEVAYESMPFSIRAMLHERVGGYIEETEADSIGLQLDLLAHHYWHSENLEKKREYLVRAGEAAEASYANAAAIDYLERAAPLVAPDERVDLLLRLGKVVELVGDWRRAEEVEREALATAEMLGDARASAWCETALAEVARKQGRYDDALSLLEQAVGTFESVGDDGGVGQVQHLMGTLAAQQGDYPKAVESYEASLVIRERLDDKAGMAGLLSNLGIVAEYRGDYSASREYHERALALRAQLDDRRAVAVSMTNLGTIAVLEHDYEEARGYFEEAMRLSREVGDPWMVANSDNNLGNATRGLGDVRRGATPLRREPPCLSRVRRQVGARVSRRRHRPARGDVRRARARLRARRRRGHAPRGDRHPSGPRAGGGAGPPSRSCEGHARRAGRGRGACSWACAHIARTCTNWRFALAIRGPPRSKVAEWFVTFWQLRLPLLPASRPRPELSARTSR